jgi:hypothetical protein
MGIGLLNLMLIISGAFGIAPFDLKNGKLFLH